MDIYAIYVTFILLTVYPQTAKFEFCDTLLKTKQEVKDCILTKANVTDPCEEYICNDDTLCNTDNLDQNIACLVNSCHKTCKSLKADCVKECLQLERCDDRNETTEYIACIRIYRNPQIPLLFFGIVICAFCLFLYCCVTAAYLIYYLVKSYKTSKKRSIDRILQKVDDTASQKVEDAKPPKTDEITPETKDSLKSIKISQVTKSID